MISRQCKEWVGDRSGDGLSKRYLFLWKEEHTYSMYKRYDRLRPKIRSALITEESKKNIEKIVCNSNGM